MIQACMGGNCGRREECANYNTEFRADPIERICIPKFDGKAIEHQVVWLRPAGTWSHEPHVVENSWSPA